MSERELVVFWAANPWDGLPATDHHLATALARRHDVLWLDPPRSVLASSTVGPVERQVQPGLCVLQVPALPAASRKGMRRATQWHQQKVLGRALARRGRRPWATISCTARYVLPHEGAGVTCLHVTDDWIAGAPMMGLDVAWLESVLRANVQGVDVLSAVSVDLARSLERFGPRHGVAVVPNGATMPTIDLSGVERRRVAVLVGQLNERIDVGLLEAVVDAGLPLRVLGPRSEREPAQRERLDHLLERPEVDWRGPVPLGQVAQHLAGASVGLTPYVDNDFNRSSFPLKTLEYLAAGLGVVSTPLESLDWLATDLVEAAATPADFAAAAVRIADAPRDEAVERRRRAFARSHSWEARADELLRLVEAADTAR